MSDTKTYRIKLMPADPYFFGGEQTFGTGDESNYFAKSNKYPQQTALLGMLRQEILFQNGKDFSKIGTDSFNGGDQQQKFGIINSISPLFLLKKEAENEEYFGWQGRSCNKEGVPFKMNIHSNCQSRFTDTISKDFLPSLSTYKEKEGIEEQLVSLQTGKTFALTDLEKNEGIVRKVFQVGILKKSTEEGFFKKESYTLAKGFSFVFFASLNTTTPFNLKDNIVLMGGDRSPFYMKVEMANGANPLGDEGEFYKAAYKNATPDGIKKLTLTCDAFVKEVMYEHILFANATVEQFRNIRSSQQTQNYSSLQKTDETDKSSLYKSGRIYLMKRGSEIYYSAENETKVLELLQHENWRTLGFNHYKIA